MGFFDTMGPAVGGSLPIGAVPRRTQPVGTPQPFDPTGYQAPGLQPSAGDGGGSEQARFMAIMQKYGPATPENLAKAEAELKAAGITVRRNGAGIAGKVQLASGEIVDVIQNAGLGGGGAWTWQQGRGGPTGEGGKPLPGNQYYGQPQGAMGSTLGSMSGSPNYGARKMALEQTPGYQFRLDQGLLGLERSAAARGTLLGGGATKDAMDYASGLASQEFQAEFARNFSLAGLGFNGASEQGQYGTSYSSNLTDLTTGTGNARANAAMQSGNAWGQAAANLGNIGSNAFQDYNYYRNRRPGTTPPYAGYGGGASGGAGGGAGWDWGNA